MERFEPISPAGHPGEPIDDFATEQLGNFQIGYAQGPRDAAIVRRFNVVCGQVTGQIQHAPQHRLRRRTIGKDHAGIQRLAHGAAVFQQPVELLQGSVIGSAHHIAQHGVARGISPVHVGHTVVLKIVQHAPGVVDIHAAETIPVVPAAHLLHGRFAAQVLGQGLHLFVGESETLIGAQVQCGIHHQVVQVGEDRFLADALHPRHNGEGQSVVALESSGEPALHEGDGFVVVALGAAAHDRDIVLVHEHDHALAVMLEQHARQPQKRRAQLAGAEATRHDLPVGPLLHRQEFVALKEVAVAGVFGGHLVGQGAEHIGPRFLLRIVEREVDEGIGPMVLAVAAALRIPDGEPLEQGSGVRCRRVLGRGNLEEALEHGQVEGLAEAAGPTEQRGFIAAVHDIGDEHTLVYEHGVLNGGDEQVVADGQHLSA